MEREVGGGIGMGNTCKPMAVSFQCMTKSTTNKKKKNERNPGYKQRLAASGAAGCEHCWTGRIGKLIALTTGLALSNKKQQVSSGER